MHDLVRRVIGAMTFSSAKYREIAAQPGATAQAIIIVLSSCVVPGSASIVYGRAGGVLYSFSGWSIWFCIAYLIGAKIFPESPVDNSVRRLLRASGFATAPALLGFFSTIRPFGHILPMVTTVWVITATVVAIREALQYRTTSRAVAVCLVSWVAASLIQDALFR
jgi:hypothetical protein